MNYPVWDVAFGAGLLIAIVAIVHVFISHFAVGSGLFLVVTEMKARRKQDTALLGWLKRHTKFFVLVSVVLGAVTGVGIWITIGLIAPTATSDLIDIYVWAWAIEWVFFLLEITAALLYLYGWDKLDARLHEWYGWVYFGAAYMSLVVINGIITFMLTSGSWTKSHRFWAGFLNPTYLPSLLLRSAIAFALAGIYALITASVQKDAALKARIVRWSALWIVPSMALTPLFGWWYIRRVPASVWASARGPMPTGTHFAELAIGFLAITFVLAMLTQVRPGRIPLAFSILVLLAAFGAMGSFEFVRESIRLPYVIDNYLYANSIYVNPTPGDGGFNMTSLDNVGVLKSARWINLRTLNTRDQVAVGREVFRVDCESCHTPNAYRGLKHYIELRQWDQNEIQAMLGDLDLMHNGVMPPFAGVDAERGALAAYLHSLAPISPGASPPRDGNTVFERNCSMCHEDRPTDPLFQNLPKDPQAADQALKSLPSLFPLMPDLELNDRERAMLVEWVNTQRGAMPSAAAQGGN